MKRIAALSAMVLAAASPAAAASIDGVWALNAADCATSAFEPGEMVVNVADGSFDFYESSCVVDRWDAVGIQETAWYATLTCQGEGMTWSAKALFALDVPSDGGFERLIEVDLDDGYVIGRYRCSSPMS